ncbi:MAG: universal stress protein [Deltaproteobacteria bacterium]|nr:universal stress protein [Deltaproteobacteria bacterium]
MYEKILICLDNSEHSQSAVALSISIAKAQGSMLTGCHVYAARLHDERFRQMESGLPERYHAEEELEKQRKTHDSLISKGLRIISDSYMAGLEEKAKQENVPFAVCHREGKNFEEIVKETKENKYDLVAMGALGLGSVNISRIGSVCERVLRRVATDALIARDPRPVCGNILVGIDGSPLSFGALLSSLALSKVYGLPVEAVAVFDPDYHYKAFKSIATVLTEEAGKLFKFKEQERLHDEIIDKGLARIYSDHLKGAEDMARQSGTKIKTTLLSGKPFDEIIKYAHETKAFFLVMGKTGVHSVEGLDIGSNTENCLREVSCHMLITSKATAAPHTEKKEDKDALLWSAEAEDILSKIPPFARGIVKNMVEETVRKEGLDTVTPELMYKVRSMMGKKPEDC